MAPAAQVLADFVAHTRYEDIPAACAAKARHCFLDLIGVTLAGAAHPVADGLAQYVRGQGCEPQATVIGRGLRTSPACAALVNGAVGHVLEYDDIKTKIGHPSVTIIPAVLALAEVLNAGGKEVLTAFVAGFEVSSKIAGMLEPELSQKGWHSTSALGIFGAAAAAGKLLRLEVGQLQNCLGIAASFAGGLVRNFGTMVKPVHAGQAAENGLKAALLAQAGITADKNIFAGKWGFPQVFAGKNDDEAMLAELGSPFEVLANGFKFYPCCASAHTSIDAVLALRREAPLDPEKVVKIEVGTVPVNLDNLQYAQPQNPTQAKFSLQFCLAAALWDGQVTLDSFSEEKMKAPTIQRLMPKISMHLHPDLAHLGYVGTENAIVAITMQGGRELVKRVDIPRGHPANPLSEEELRQKYFRCAARSVSEETAKASAQMILAMDTLTGIDELMRLVG